MAREGELGWQSCCSICKSMTGISWECIGSCKRRICYQCLWLPDVGGREFHFYSKCKTCRAEEALTKNV